MSCRDDSCALMLDAKEVPRSTDTRVQVESISVEELSGKGTNLNERHPVEIIYPVHCLQKRSMWTTLIWN